jgi:hypothetical protein
MPKLIDYLNSRAQNDRAAREQAAERLEEAENVLNILLGEEGATDDNQTESP